MSEEDDAADEGSVLPEPAGARRARARRRTRPRASARRSGARRPPPRAPPPRPPPPPPVASTARRRARRCRPPPLRRRPPPPPPPPPRARAPCAAGTRAKHAGAVVLLLEARQRPAASGGSRGGAAAGDGPVRSSGGGAYARAAGGGGAAGGPGTSTSGGGHARAAGGARAASCASSVRDERRLRRRRARHRLAVPLEVARLAAAVGGEVELGAAARPQAHICRGQSRRVNSSGVRMRVFANDSAGRLRSSPLALGMVLADDAAPRVQEGAAMREDDAAGGGVELNENASRLLERIESMSVRELKQLIAQAGLSTDDVVEKADLRARALSVLALNPSAAPPGGTATDECAGGAAHRARAAPHGSAAGPVCTKEEGADDQPASSGTARRRDRSHARPARHWYRRQHAASDRRCRSRVHRLAGGRATGGGGDRDDERAAALDRRRGRRQRHCAVHLFGGLGWRHSAVRRRRRLVVHVRDGWDENVCRRVTAADAADANHARAAALPARSRVLCRPLPRPARRLLRRRDLRLRLDTARPPL